MEKAESARLIGFDRAEVVGGFAGGHFLIVSGVAPCINMTVELARRSYVGWHAIRGELETEQSAFNSVVIHCHGDDLTTITRVPVVE